MKVGDTVKKDQLLRRSAALFFLAERSQIFANKARHRLQGNERRALQSPPDVMKESRRSGP
jgi:hypothetical protein